MSSHGHSPAAHGRRAGVLAVDDQASFLDLLRDVLHASEELDLLGEAATGEHAIELADELRPEMVLMDVRLPGMGGIRAAKRIKASHPSTLVILISTTHPDELPPDAGEGGVDAYIWKSELDPKLLDDLWLHHREERRARLRQRRCE